MDEQISVLQITISELSEDQMHRAAKKMDLRVPSLIVWRYIAKYTLSPSGYNDLIKKIERDLLSKNDASPSYRLLCTLHDTTPDLRISKIVQLSRFLRRHDIAKILHEITSEIVYANNDDQLIVDEIDYRFRKQWDIMDS